MQLPPLFASPPLEPTTAAIRVNPTAVDGPLVHGSIRISNLSLTTNAYFTYCLYFAIYVYKYLS